MRLHRVLGSLRLMTSEMLWTFIPIPNAREATMVVLSFPPVSSKVQVSDHCRKIMLLMSRVIHCPMQ